MQMIQKRNLGTKTKKSSSNSLINLISVTTI